MNILFGLRAPGLLWPACCRLLCAVCVHFQAGRPCAAAVLRGGPPRVSRVFPRVAVTAEATLYCFYTATVFAERAAVLLIVPSVSSLAVCSFVFLCAFSPSYVLTSLKQMIFFPERRPASPQARPLKDETESPQLTTTRPDARTERLAGGGGGGGGGSGGDHSWKEASLGEPTPSDRPSPADELKVKMLWHERLMIDVLA